MQFQVLGFIFLAVLVGFAAVIFTLMFSSLFVKKKLWSKKDLAYFAPAVVLIFLLHLTASAYVEELTLFTCINSIGYTLDYFVFRVELSLIEPLIQAYPVYFLNFALASLISSATLILSFFAFFNRRMNNFIKVKARLKKGTDVIVGDSPSALRYQKENENSVIWGRNLSRQRCNELMKEGHAVFSYVEGAPLRKKLSFAKHNVIAFADGDYSYAEIIAETNRLCGEGCDLSLYLEADTEEMQVIRESFIPHTVVGQISCFSKYETAASKFVCEHPITKYLPRSFLLPNFAVKPEKEINVVFLGYGKMNRQMLRTCIPQFQFATVKGDKLQAKPVNYYVYDREAGRLGGDLVSRLNLEFDRDFSDCDFPKPEKICNLTLRNSDVYSLETREEFTRLVSEKTFTYFILSLENDFCDASYAKTLQRLLPEGENYRIFVRTRKEGIQGLSEKDGIICFGQEDDSYDHEFIVNDELLLRARRMNAFYGSTGADAPEWVKQLKNLPAEEKDAHLSRALSTPEGREYLRASWESLPYIERISNLSHAMNLSFKLRLLGFAMEKREGETKGVSETEFLTSYVNTGKTTGYHDYSYFFATEAANVLAYIEHLRWNATYFLAGYRQLKKKDIAVVQQGDKKTVPHKNTQKKLHACLTTYYGLHELVSYKYALLRPGTQVNSLPGTDPLLRELGMIYAYDYQDLDKLYGEITALNYVLKKS